MNETIAAISLPAVHDRKNALYPGGVNNGF